VEIIDSLVSMLMKIISCILAGCRSIAIKQVVLYMRMR